MNRMGVCLMVLIGLVWAPAFCAAAQIPADADIVAIIVKIEGTVFWKKAAAAQPAQLDPLKDIGRVVLFKEWVKVDPGSTLRVVDLRNKKPTEAPISTPRMQAAQWVTFPHLPSEDQAALWHVLTAFSELGGRKRGASSVFFSPAPESVVRPEHLVFQWTPDSSEKPVSLSITEANPSISGAKPIWHQENVDGRTGRLDSPEARSALQAYRTGGSHNPLVLALTQGEAKAKSVQFSLLVPRDETELTQQLADMDELPALLRHTGRAYILNAFKLYNEAADEYEAALAAAPNSTPLLLAAISAQQQTGNKAREEALRKRLPPSVKVPGDE